MRKSKKVFNIKIIKEEFDDWHNIFLFTMIPLISLNL